MGHPSRSLTSLDVDEAGPEGGGGSHHIAVCWAMAAKGAGTGVLAVTPGKSQSTFK